jgi:hypothetical protein
VQAYLQTVQGARGSRRGWGGELRGSIEKRASQWVGCRPGGSFMYLLLPELNRARIICIMLGSRSCFLHAVMMSQNLEYLGKSRYTLSLSCSQCTI